MTENQEQDICGDMDVEHVLHLLVRDMQTLKVDVFTQEALMERGLADATFELFVEAHSAAADRVETARAVVGKVAETCRSALSAQIAALPAKTLENAAILLAAADQLLAQTDKKVGLGDIDSLAWESAKAAFFENAAETQRMSYLVSVLRTNPMGSDESIHEDARSWALGREKALVERGDELAGFWSAATAVMGDKLGGEKRAQALGAIDAWHSFAGEIKNRAQEVEDDQ